MSLPSNPSRTFILANPHLYGHRTPPEVPDAKPAQRSEALAGDGEGKAPGTGRPLVCFILRRVRLLDTDAKWGSIKDLLDGLAIARLIPGDREGQIRLHVEQEAVPHFKEEETLIRITYP